MGYVYTPDEFTKGMIASPQNYTRAMEKLRESLKQLFELGYIHGANIHGSNIHGDGGFGSDIDALVVTNKPFGRAEEALSRLRKNTFDSEYVPVDFVPVPIGLARTGQHNIDFFYAQYMRDFCGNSTVGNDPLSEIKPNESWGDKKSEVREKFRNQLSKLPKQRANIPLIYGAEYCDHLEKLLRWPVYAAIDMLRLKNDGMPSRDGKPLPKGECCALYEAEFSDMDSVFPDLRIVIGTRNDYKEALQNHSADFSHYIRMLERANNIYPNAMNFIEANLEVLSRVS